MSMEFLMGRTLTNSMVNLGIDSEVEEALYEVHCAHPVLPPVHTCSSESESLLLVLLF